MPKAVIKIEPRVLGHALRFPSGHEAVFARVNDEGQIELLVEGASFPPADEGALLPRFALVVHEPEAAKPSEFHPARKGECAARRQGTAGGNDPADCDWPFCGCDPAASRVVETLLECGWSAPTPPSAPSK